MEKFKPGQGGAIHTSNSKALVFATRKGGVSIPYERVNLLEYGQNVSRRVALALAIVPLCTPCSPVFLLAKQRKHFLTLGFADEGGQQAMVFRVEKGQIRVLLASLEARTGVKVTFQDDEARKAGK